MQLLTEKKTKAESHEICVQHCKDNQVCQGYELGGLLGCPGSVCTYLYTDI